MKNITIIYWSSTGNTESMAKAICEGVETHNEGDIMLKLMHVSEASVQDVEHADVVVMGCPAMGVESLDSSEMEPFVNRIKGVIKDKSVALFGSYDWGDGEWIEEWQGDMEKAGAQIIAENLMINNEPDEEGLKSCREYGEALYNYMI